MADKPFSHPLAAFEDDADEEFLNPKAKVPLPRPKPPAPKPTNLHSSSSMPSSLSSTATTKTSHSNGQKRMAPKVPEAQSIPRLNEEPSPSDTFSSFYISVDHVRWFYKEEKKSSSASTTTSPSNANNANGAAVSYANPLGATAGSVSPDVLDASLDPSVSLNLNDSIPGTSASSNKWQPFNKWDSAMLENEFRERQTLKSPGDARLVQVLNNLYEVDLAKRRCYPIYWENESVMTVMRAIWFQDKNEPFEEKYGIEIERKHLELFKDAILKSKSNEPESPPNGESEPAQTPDLNTSASSSSVNATPTKTNKKEADTQIEPVGSLTIDSGVITWYSKDEIYYEKNKSNFMDVFSKFVKRNKITGSKIKRGFKEKEKESAKDKEKDKEVKTDEKPGEITHLVFVIHGIAQKLFQNNIVKKCDELRTFCEKAKDDYLTSHKNLRYMFLPVDWRSSLTLDDGIVDSITLKTVSSIRNTLNSSALDIMYYTSPLFRQEIMNSLSSEVNRLYNLFCLKNPNFREKYNKVSFIAHSLGSVIIYDILTSNNSPTQFSNLYGEDMAKEEKLFTRFSHNDSELLREYLEHKNKLQEVERKLVQMNENITPLDFRTENLFCLGSPLPVFLALRGVRPAGSGKQDHVLPKHLCKRLYNVFHPSDPVAYRIEPLILKHYATKDAIEILRVSDPLAPKATYKDANDKRKPVDFDLQANLSKGTVKKEKDSKSAELEVSSSGYTQTSPTKDPLNQTIDQVELESGFDFKLKNTFTLNRIDHPLTLTIVAWQAHTCYWNSEDTTLFIMSQLCTNDSE